MVAHSVLGKVPIAMHVHKKLRDIVIHICMLSFTVAVIIIATVAHMSGDRIQIQIQILSILFKYFNFSNLLSVSICMY